MADDDDPCSLQTLTLSDVTWRYKGEGNANVVLAVPADGTVLRVTKDDGGGGGTAEALWLRARYCDAVRRAFFGEHADVPVPARVAAEQLREIDRRLREQGCRPPNRTHKALGWTAGLVAVCPDYTVLWPRPAAAVAASPVHCVEIKPKQGWLHEADRGAAARCAFCAHQYLKLGRGDASRISLYCPLDLFSGRGRRVRRAVRGLLRTPQNNLKMFLDGAPLDPDGGDYARPAAQAFGGSTDRFCAFVAAALLDGFADVRQHSAPEQDDRTPAEEDRGACDFDAVPLPDGCVLRKILAAQKMQTAGFAQVCSEYDRRTAGRPDESAAAAAQFGHVYRLLRQSALDPVDGYLVAATARDCSVFVTFCRCGGGDRQQMHRGGDVVLFDDFWYAVRVKVSDLDPKPLSTVDKHRKRNAQVASACERYFGRK